MTQTIPGSDVQKGVGAAAATPAARAADGHPRITGAPARAGVTAGPGTSDAVTGVATAS